MKSSRIVPLLAAFLAAAVAAGRGENNILQPPAQDPSQIIDFLSRTISWYRQLAVEQQLITQPSDLTFLQENRRVAGQIVQMAFDYARSQAQLQARQPSRSQPSEQASSGQIQGLVQAAQKTDQELQDTQAELRSVREKLAGASPARKRAVDAQVSELESEIGLLQARRDALQSMVEFVNSSNAGSTGVGLRAQIEELARSVPVSLSRASGTNAPETTPEPSSQNNAIARKAEPTGLWGLAADLIHLSRKKHTLEDEMAATGDLRHDADQLRRPLVEYLGGLVRHGDELFAAADVAT